MTGYIYKIENLINGKFYIGSTKDPNKRKTTHFSSLKHNRHHNIYLQRVYNKYGKENLIFVILDETEYNLLELERIYIDEYAPEYNIGSVGGGDNLTNHPNKEKIIYKRTLTVLKNMEILGKEGRSIKYGRFKENNANWKDGKTYCKCGNRKACYAKTCIKCRDITGSNNPFFGKTHSVETKKKISEAMKGNIPPNAREIFAEDTIYPSLAAAGRAYNITASAMQYRVRSNSKKWEEFFYCDEV